MERVVRQWERAVDIVPAAGREDCLSLLRVQRYVSTKSFLGCKQMNFSMLLLLLVV